MSEKKSTILKDVNAAKFIAAYATHLKKGGKIQVPSWVDCVKTGHGAELAPYNPDWYYIRVASVARKIYLHGVVGVGFLTRLYPKNVKRGPATAHFGRGSPSIARSVLKNLESLGIVEKLPQGGRRLTSAGRRELDRISGVVASH